jgi:hypothetical protein
MEMKKEIKEIVWGTLIGVFAGTYLLLAPVKAIADEQMAVIEQKLIEWTDFHSVAGQCKMKFPNLPEHVSEKLSVPEEGYDMKYDAYISASDQESMFMLLIAQYPEFVDESFAQMSLETFLNGILTHNPSNQLIFADLALVEGHEALDFFIRTGSVYFKGRAVMVKNSLYLMAMECEMQNYDEDHFNTFVESFSLVNIEVTPEKEPMQKEEQMKKMMPQEQPMQKEESMKKMMPQEQPMQKEEQMHKMMPEKEPMQKKSY